MKLARLATVSLACAGTLLLSGCPGPVPVPVEPTPAPGPTPTPVPTPTPPPYVPYRKTETGKIFNGMEYKVTLETEYGTTATEEREDPSSYRAELVFKVKVPKPHQRLEDITKLNPKLPELLPALPKLIENAKISPVFDDLYRLKTNQLQANLNRMDIMLSRHNFYDCETMLEMQHPETKRRAIFIQSDMDVDTDGSDVDRVPEIEGASSTFQPFTSYRWPKKTGAVSPLIAPREAKIRELETEAAGAPQARKDAIKSSIKSLKDEIGDLKTFRFLIGHADPFIVLPFAMFGASQTGPFAPRVGDYCVVIHEGVLYPAIVGDVGPRMKMGEGSLRLCKQLLPKASGAYRAVSDLKVTYLVFPQTAEKPFAVPDLDKWRAKCEELLKEMGGYEGELFTWEDITKPEATPAPPTTPAPASATPAPVATPAATPVAATPAPTTPAP